MEGRGYYTFFRVHFQSLRNFPWFLSPRGNHISSKDALRDPLRFLSLSPLFFQLLLFLSSPQSPTPYGGAVTVVTPLRLYKFYIIFMRHKVVEKPTRRKEKRVGEELWVGWRGLSRVQACSRLSPSSLPPFADRQSRGWAERFSTPSCSATTFGVRKGGMATVWEGIRRARGRPAEVSIKERSSPRVLAY